jgi:hypothetical protein
MNQTILQQYRYDIEMWKRLLFNSQEENILLKYRLSEFSSSIQGKEHLELLEYHQSSLLKIDDIFSTFKNDIYHYNLSIEKEISFAEEQTELNISRHKKMSNEIELIESTFNKSKFLFTNFINEVLNNASDSN